MDKQAEEIANKITNCFKRGGKVIIFGNGGSLADATHFAAEFWKIGPVIALNDPAKITAIANDTDFEDIFSIQVEYLVNKKDLVIGLSSSGNSDNVNFGLARAERLEIEAIAFPRKGNNTQEVQDWQHQLLHKIYLLVEKNQ